MVDVHIGKLRQKIKPAPAMFVDAVHRYLIWAFAGAIGLAIMFSFVACPLKFFT